MRSAPSNAGSLLTVADAVLRDPVVVRPTADAASAVAAPPTPVAAPAVVAPPAAGSPVDAAPVGMVPGAAPAVVAPPAAGSPVAPPEVAAGGATPLDPMAASGREAVLVNDEPEDTSIHVVRPEDDETDATTGPDVVRPEEDEPELEGLAGAFHALFEATMDVVDDRIEEEQEDTWVDDLGDTLEGAAWAAVETLLDMAEAAGGAMVDVGVGLVDLAINGLGETGDAGDTILTVLDKVLFDPIAAGTGGLVDADYDGDDLSVDLGVDEILQTGFSAGAEGWEVRGDYGFGPAGHLEADIGEDADGDFYTNSDLALHFPTQFGTFDVAAETHFEENDEGGFTFATEGTIGVTSLGGQRVGVGAHLSTTNDGEGNSETTVGVHQVVGQVGLVEVRVEENVILVEEDGEFQGTRGQVVVEGHSVVGDFREEADLWDATQDDVTAPGRRGGRGGAGADDTTGPDVVRPADDTTGPDVVRPADDTSEQILDDIAAALDAVDDAIAGTGGGSARPTGIAGDLDDLADDVDVVARSVVAPRPSGAVDRVGGPVARPGGEPAGLMEEEGISVFASAGRPPRGLDVVRPDPTGEARRLAGELEVAELEVAEPDAAADELDDLALTQLAPAPGELDTDAATGRHLPGVRALQLGDADRFGAAGRADALATDDLPTDGLNQEF